VWAAALALSCARGAAPARPTEPSTSDGRRETSASARPAASAAPAPSAPAPTMPPPEPPKLGGPGSHAVAGTRGVVVSADLLATRAGVDVLEAGGNAMDAAVATAAALAVTHPSAGNLGGGGFLLVHAPGRPTVALDFRETAPSSLVRAEFDRMITNHGQGPVAVGVPGSVAGLLVAERRFGRLPLPDVLHAAIELARKGHPFAASQARALAANWASLRLDPAIRRVFARPDGKPLSGGSKLVQTDLAATLERILTLGEAGFYAGRTAHAIIDATQGHISEGDLTAYRALLREPLHLAYGGFTIESMPPPSTGGVVLLGELSALSALDADATPEESAAESHLFVEVSRRAQAERRLSIIDPDALSPEARDTHLALLLDPTKLLRVPVDPAHATPSARVHPLYDDALRETEHTTHLSVVDAEGMVVSLTTTLSASFGARRMAAGTGVLLGNAVASFSSIGENQPVPGRRTTSSMAPTLVLLGGKPVLVLGTPGGDTIPSTLALLVRRLIDRKQPLDAAVDAPRMHHGFVPDSVRYESARPPPLAVLDGLKALGHHLSPSGAAQGDANCILIDGGTAYGYADRRESGGLALAATR